MSKQITNWMLVSKTGLGVFHTQQEHDKVFLKNGLALLQSTE